MPTQLRRWVLGVCVVVGLGGPEDVRAQADPQNFLFNAGQTIQPFYDGWAHNPDGSFEMHFGYLNRNYVEEVQVQIGSNNRISPEGPDRGQPNYFYPRVNRRVFSVTRATAPSAGCSLNGRSLRQVPGPPQPKALRINHQRWRSRLPVRSRWVTC